MMAINPIAVEIFPSGSTLTYNNIHYTATVKLFFNVCSFFVVLFVSVSDQMHKLDQIPCPATNMKTSPEANAQEKP